MKLLQLVLLAAFAFCALITAFFQLRTGMKQGRGDNDTNKTTKMAHIFAAISALCLIACIAAGAISK